MTKIHLHKRGAIGLCCIGLALLLSFVALPAVNKLSQGKVSVYRLTQDVPSGTLLERSMYEVLEIRASGLPDTLFTGTQEPAGQYAVRNLYAGDLLTGAALAATVPLSYESLLNSVGGGQYAVSVTLDSMAAGLSGKLRPGDIVSVLVIDSQTRETFVPAALTYVQVLTCTSSTGADTDDSSDTMPVTLTLLGTLSQVKALVGYARSSALHFALVCRADSPLVQSYLEKQAGCLGGMA